MIDLYEPDYDIDPSEDCDPEEDARISSLYELEDAINAATDPELKRVLVNAHAIIRDMPRPQEPAINDGYDPFGPDEMTEVA